MRAGSGEAARLGSLATSLFEQAQILAQTCTRARLPAPGAAGLLRNARRQSSQIRHVRFDPAALKET